jgi:Ion transport protein
MERFQTQAPYLVFILGLSILALGLLGGEAILKPDEDTRAIIDYADFAICMLFFLDFVITFSRAENRVRYLLTWGWLDLISSIPMIDPLRWGRAARIVRILRILRGVRATRVLAAPDAAVAVPATDLRPQAHVRRGSCTARVTPQKDGRFKSVVISLCRFVDRPTMQWPRLPGEVHDDEASTHWSREKTELRLREEDAIANDARGEPDAC